MRSRTIASYAISCREVQPVLAVRRRRPRSNPSSVSPRRHGARKRLRCPRRAGSSWVRRRDLHPFDFLKSQSAPPSGDTPRSSRASSPRDAPRRKRRSAVLPLEAGELGDPQRRRRGAQRPEQLARLPALPASAALSTRYRSTRSFTASSSAFWPKWRSSPAITRRCDSAERKPGGKSRWQRAALLAVERAPRRVRRGRPARSSRAPPPLVPSRRSPRLAGPPCSEAVASAGNGQDGDRNGNGNGLLAHGVHSSRLTTPSSQVT